MNDPGPGEPISNDARDVENQQHDEHDEHEEEEQAFLEPRYVNYCQKRRFLSLFPGSFRVNFLRIKRMQKKNKGASWNSSPTTKPLSRKHRRQMLRRER